MRRWLPAALIVLAGLSAWGVGTCDDRGSEREYREALREMGRKTDESRERARELEREAQRLSN